MKIIYRYLTLEFIPPFIYAFCLVTLIILLNLIVQMLGKIAGKGLDPYVVMEFFFFGRSHGRLGSDSGGFRTIVRRE